MNYSEMVRSVADLGGDTSAGGRELSEPRVCRSGGLKGPGPRDGANKSIGEECACSVSAAQRLNVDQLHGPNPMWHTLEK